MIRAIKEHVIIGSGGLIEIRRPDLPEGAAAEVTVTIQTPDSEPPPLSSLLGKAQSGYDSGEQADAFIRAERDAWNR